MTEEHAESTEPNDPNDVNDHNEEKPRRSGFDLSKYQAEREARRAAMTDEERAAEDQRELEKVQAAVISLARAGDEHIRRTVSAVVLNMTLSESLTRTLESVIKNFTSPLTNKDWIAAAGIGKIDLAGLLPKPDLSGLNTVSPVLLPSTPRQFKQTINVEVNSSGCHCACGCCSDETEDFGEDAGEAQ